MYLADRELLLLDWSETTLDLLVTIDEAKAWPLVREDIPEVSGWMLSRLLPHLSVEHQLDLAREWIRTGRSDAWDWDRMVVAIAHIPAPEDDLEPVIEELSGPLNQYPGWHARRPNTAGW